MKNKIPKKVRDIGYLLLGTPDMSVWRAGRTANRFRRRKISYRTSTVPHTVISSCCVRST